MNREDITRMARKAGFVGFDGDNGSLRRFAALVAEAEREACAKMCDDAVNSISETADAEVREVATNVCINLGRAIRARGTT